MSLRRTLSQGTKTALFLLWCLGWPLVVTWAAVASVIWLVVVGVVVAAGTPLLLHALDRRALQRQRRGHAVCHKKFDRFLEKLRVLHSFREYECAANQLEGLSDALRRLPPHARVVPGRVADTVDERVEALRAMAPDPPLIQLPGLLKSADLADS